jgi:hypothetical protein
MRKLVAFVALVMIAVPATAQVHVRGYVKKDGTYVAPYERTRPNNTTADNYDTPGNYNPNTGRITPGRSYEPPVYTPPRYTPPSQPQSGYTPYQPPCYYNCTKR